MTKGLFLIIFSWAAFASAGLKDDCTFFYVKTGAMDIYRQFESTTCSISAHPQAAGMVYRSYGFSSDSSFMVFNSYGSGNNSAATGARVFYLFPRNHLPSLDNSGANPEVTASSDRAVFQFDRKSTKLLGLKDGAITEDTNVNRKNKGGVEILSYNGLVIDVGFSLGADPTSNPNGEALARDYQNRECKMQNKELFDYALGQFTFKFKSDDALKAFMAKRCSNLVLNF